MNSPRLAYIPDLCDLHERLDYQRETARNSQYSGHESEIRSLLHQYPTPETFLRDLKAEWETYICIAGLLDRFLDVFWKVPVTSLARSELAFAGRLHAHARRFNYSKYVYSLTIKPMIEREISSSASNHAFTSEQVYLTMTPMMGSFWEHEYLSLARLWILEIGGCSSFAQYRRNAQHFADQFLGSLEYLEYRKRKMGFRPDGASPRRLVMLQDQIEDLQHNLRTCADGKIHLLVSVSTTEAHR